MPHPRPSWPRHLRRVCVFLVLGLGTTVGVAWGLALTLPMHTAHYRHLDLPGDRRNVEQGWDSLSAASYIRFGTVRRVWFGISYRRYAHQSPPWAAVAFDTPNGESALVNTWSVGGPLTWGRLPYELNEFRGEREFNDGVEEARGWPALALWAGYCGFDAYGSTAPLEVYGGLPLAESARSGSATGGSNPTTVRALPLLPIWPGLAFNTLYYALLWWLAFASTRMVKHNRRYRHGLCPRCRYDLRADYSQGCSECGWGR